MNHLKGIKCTLVPSLGDQLFYHGESDPWRILCIFNLRGEDNHSTPDNNVFERWQLYRITSINEQKPPP